jgi:hypothetical protein
MSDASTERPLTRKDIEAKIVALAWQDDDFRRKFVTDPKGQFEERLGVRLPDSLTMTVHEEDGDSLHFVIPMKPRTTLDELSDEELERVAGGTDVVTTVVLSLISAAGIITGTLGAAAASLATGGWR